MTKRRIIPYNPKLKEKARHLRKTGTKSEILLWKKLQCKQLHGYTFLRQRPIDEYIVDFYCPALNLVIEIDGITHEDKQPYDFKRQRRIESYGLKVIRFYDSEVKENLDGVVQYLLQWIREHGG
jgi:very-short-patch-repair endonuclease